LGKLLVQKAVDITIADAEDPLAPGKDCRLEAQALESQVPGVGVVASVPLRCTDDFLFDMMKYHFEINPPQTEVAAVADVAKRIAPYFTREHGGIVIEDALLFALELWGLCSENMHGPGIPLLTPTLRRYDRELFEVPPWSTLGWRPRYLDDTNEEAAQRHHFCFFYAVGVQVPQPLATLEAFVCDYIFDTSNAGDYTLGMAAISLGASTRRDSSFPDDVSILSIGYLIEEEFAE